MVSSYALVRVQPSMEREIYKKVKAFPEVKGIVLTYGEYDFILKIETASLDELDHFVFNKLRGTEGIVSTTTLIEARPPSIVEEK